MKRLKSLTLFSALLLAYHFGMGQASIGFSNLNGFPTFVSNGSHYNLSGWIVNHGNASVSGSVDLQLLPIGGNTITIDNNVNLGGTLAPGDSVYWSKNNHTFPPGQFRLGANDVLIWPTAPSGSSAEVDTSHTSIYYTNGAVLRIDPSTFTQYAAGWDLSESYEVDIKLKNIGDVATSENIMVYVALEGFAPEVLLYSEHSIDPGAEFEISVEHVNLSHLYRIGAASPTKVAFYATEATMPSPYNQVSLDVYGTATSAPSPQALPNLEAYPNPTRGDLHIQLPDSWKPGAMVHIFDMAGRLMLSTVIGEQLDLSHLVRGCYLLEIESPKGKLHQRVIVD